MKRRLRSRFRLLVTAQVLLLILSITLLLYSLITTDYFAVPVVIGVIVGLQVIALIRSLEAHVVHLEEFFAAINYEDLTHRFVADDVDAELQDAFNLIVEQFQLARAERDVQANYLEMVVRHVPVPFLAARADGSLSLVNQPARRLTGLPALHHIEDLAVLDAQLPQRIRNIDPGRQQLIQTTLRGSPAELRVSVSELRMAGETERLYALENLSGELTARESSAWRNLIRVLTHEIMNSLTPVSSLAQTCQSMLEDADVTPDLREAVGTIARRSEGLMQFVSKYRELLQVPEPSPENLEMLEVLNGIVTLTGNELQGIDVNVEVVPASLQIMADRNLLEQVLLNLVRNAADALKEAAEPSIHLRARLDFGRVLVQVADNGQGIPQNLMDQIFIPFFTTKRGGSGIGLSLCRQIMTAHGGQITVDSSPGDTRISLRF